MTQLSPNSMDLTQIGHYTILSSIGRGGMGLVYLARDTRLDRQVAIKCLRTELFEPHYRERFKREALLLAKLNHPHIVQIYDYVESNEQLALVMEYVNGQNLQQHLREHIVPLTQRMQWLTQIAQGLGIAHDAGIIHRDLKAENILINQHKLAKITDLGIAKSQDFNSTLTDHVTGSYTSMSPEQAMGEELDFRSDLFSFGILAYQLLCGAHPFGDTENKLQLMQRIISHPPVPPTKNNPDLPAEAVQLLGQLLSKDPNNRPANTHWVAAQCEKLSQLIIANSVITSDNTEMLPHAQGSHSGIRKNNTRNTQEHPTFETRFEKIKPPLFQRTKTYIVEHRSVVAVVSVLLLIIAGVTIWQLQPKPPKYVAVLPPNLTANGMQESQQELVKGAVYDAIQQSVLQLDGYYLIPQNEIADINAANNKEGIETVRRATAADELITTDIQCKIEACTITLSRLTPDGKKQESRLRVQDTKTVDVLTDNYLSVATIVQSNVGGLYSENMNNLFAKIDEKEYSTFLEINRKYREYGANTELLTSLNNLQQRTKNTLIVQTLLVEIALDIYYETKNKSVLEEIETNLGSYPQKNNKNYLYNLYYLQIAKNEFDDASKTIKKIEKLNTGNASINELYAYAMLAKKDYKLAIDFYIKSLSSKTTANTLLNIAKAYWYSGDTVNAKKYTAQSLTLSPNYYKTHSLNGLIFLYEGNISAAETSFNQVIKQRPNDIVNLNGFGLCQLLLGRYDLASNLFDKVSTLAPDNTLSWLNKADAKNLAGKIEESKEIYRKILTDSENLGKSNSEKFRNSSQAYAHLGEYTEALTILQELEKLDPQNIETTYTAAIVHTLANNKTSAILNIENTLKNGMNKIWFNFSWFDPLCTDTKFVEIMKNYGEPNRCSPP